KLAHAPATRFGGLLVLAILAPIAGAAAGLVGAIFRLTLEAADRFRNDSIAAAHQLGVPGFLLVTGSCAAAVAAAAWLVRQFSPYASGSGIPHVEAALNEEVPPAPPSLLPVKFLGGVLAIGAGLALGREGPSVQMGAAIAHAVGRAFRRGWADCRVLLAAGAGAGLATAFNAPIAGAVFVLEELVRRFEARIAIAALGASAAAIAVARAVLGDADGITQRTLVGGETMPILALAFLLRFGLGPVSYAAATPGGLFAPILVLGAQLGLLCGIFCRLAFPNLELDPTAFTVVGMAA